MIIMTFEVEPKSFISQTLNSRKLCLCVIETWLSNQTSILELKIKNEKINNYALLQLSVVVVSCFSDFSLPLPLNSTLNWGSFQLGDIRLGGRMSHSNDRRRREKFQLLANHTQMANWWASELLQCDVVSMTMMTNIKLEKRYFAKYELVIIVRFGTKYIKAVKIKKKRTRRRRSGQRNWENLNWTSYFRTIFEGIGLETLECSSIPLTTSNIATSKVNFKLCLGSTLW